MKGAIQANHIPKNKARFTVAGITTQFTFTTISEINNETETVELPDRTVASGGQDKSVEFTATLPMHHDAEIGAMRAWRSQARDPVHPAYKKSGTLIMERIGGGLPRMFLLKGCFPNIDGIPGYEMANEGEMQVMTYTFKADECIPVT